MPNQEMSVTQYYVEAIPKKQIYCLHFTISLHLLVKPDHPFNVIVM
jgi:hypothetical protein